jgi:hypothetical protein
MRLGKISQKKKYSVESELIRTFTHNKPMGKRQPAQKKPSSKATRPAPAAAKTAYFVFNLFVSFTRRHPFLCLTGMWLLMIWLGWMSAQGIFYADSSPLESEKTTETVVQANQPQPQPRNYQSNQAASSFGALIVLALCCAGTTLLLARQLRPVKPTPQRRAVVKQRGNAQHSSTQSARRPAQPRATAPQPAASQVPSAPQAPAVPPPPMRANQPVSYQVSRQSPRKEGEPDLADLMDIRNRRAI